MDTICKCVRPNRRKSSTDCGEAVREILHPHRGKVVHLGDDGIRLRERTAVLLPPDNGSPSKQKGDCSTSQRMVRLERRCSTAVRKVSVADNDSNVFVATRPLQSGGSPIVSGMLSISIGRNVSFDDVVHVYSPIDWSPNVYRRARKGPWMHIAADRCRFRRRINETESNLGHIFTINHRDKVKRRLFIE